MEHADLAQLAAVCGALGSALALLARSRVALLAGLGALTAAEAGLAASLGNEGVDKLSSAAGAAAAVVGLAVCGVAAWFLARRPALIPVLVLLAAPFRPPLAFDSANRFFVSVATDGRLGRLLPLYFVLAAAGARWRGARSGARRCARYPAPWPFPPRPSSPSPCSPSSGPTTWRRGRT